MSSTPMVDVRADWRVVGDLLPLLDCDSEREGWTRAVEIAQHLFGGDLAITIEFVHDDRAVFRSSVGLELPIGDQTFPCAPDSQAAFVVRSGAPCRSDDIALDDRFVASALLTSVGVRSSLTSAFVLANGRSVLIGVHSRSPGLFDHEDETAFGEFTDFVGTAMRSIRRRAVLERGAHFDPLTDLANRPTIIEFLGEQIAVGRSEVTSMLIDLDGFKTVNDDHGHRTGDVVLRTVAARIERCLSLGDRLGRLGGDEFLLVTDTPDVSLLTERILGHIEEAILVEGRLVQVSASIGVARRRSDDDATSMIERADRLMYSAKSVGRGTMRSDVRVGQRRATTRRDDPGRVSSSLALVDDAIARLRIAVQPIVHAGCHTVRGVEVLSRGPLDHPLEFPDRLFAAAATFGRLGELELASKVLAFEAVVPDDLDLYVNLEPALLCDEEWLARLTAAWVQSNSTRPVVAELTEREVLRSPGSLIRAVEACRELGWKIALDDLGSRSESLAALRWIRPDVVKLDMSLIENDNPAHAAHIVAAIAAYRETNGGAVEVIAEGVETPEHEEHAHVLGADMLQGYRFGRPSSVEDLALHHEPSDTTALLRLGANPNGRIATKRDLLHMSRHVESGVLTADCVLLSALQHADHLSWRTRRQYRALARRCGFVGMIGVDLSRAGGNELSGVRTADLRREDPMTANWWVIAMSPTTSIGLLATEIQHDPTAGPLADMERLFSYRFISDPGEVEDAARALLRYF